MKTNIEHHPARRIEAINQGHRLWSYTYDGYDFHPHFHPIQLPGLPVLTMERPGDHPWHEGMFFSWKYLNGLNVWNQPLNEAHGFPRHRNIEIQENGFVHYLDWVDAQDNPILKEERIILFEWREETGVMVFDWDLRFCAVGAPVVCEREAKWGGYGGLSIRCARGSQPEFTSDSGLIKEVKDANPTSPWVDLSYNPDGMISRGWLEYWMGVSLFEHASNPQHPTNWWLYGELFKVNAAVLQRTPLTLDKEHPLRLRYRVLIHRGKADPAKLAAEWASYNE